MAIEVEHLPAAAELFGDVSKRERDVVDLLVEGFGSREIAEQLVVTEATVTS